MRTFWLCFNGTLEEEKRLSIPFLGYPLSYNIPRVSWSETRGTIQLNPQTKRFAVHVDILIEVGAQIRKCNVQSSDINAYRICIGVADTSMADSLPHMSIRDNVVNQYYARFHEACNIVGPNIPVKKCDKLREQILIVNCGKYKLAIPVNFRFQSQDVLTFLGNFTTLRPGDLVSLGSIWRGEFEDRQIVNCLVECLGISLSLEIK